MKTILAPTDFSAASLNATEYAMQIAGICNAKLVLFHAYNLPVIPVEVPAVIPIAEIQQDAVTRLKEIKKHLSDTYGQHIPVDYNCSLGYPVEEISSFAKECNADLIVMGMEGAGFLKEKVIGSTTTALIKRSKCPVLAIDKHIVYKSIKKIVFTSDYDQINSKSVLAPLVELAQIFKSHIYVLNVVSENETIPAIGKAVEGIRLDHLLEETEHSFHYSENGDVVKAINQFVEENKIDMVVMIPRTQSVFRDLFRQHRAKNMAFHSIVPLLTLPEHA